MEVQIDHEVRRSPADASCAPACAPRRCRSTSKRYSRISRSRCVALLVGELEEDALALGVLEPLAVALEEPVRAALAPDADHQRLAVVDALGELIGAGGEQTVGRALEEQERRPRLELRILLQQLAVARLELAEMLLLLLGQLLEHAAAARVARDARGARVELQAAALGGNRDPQRVAREQQLGRAALGGGRPPGAARLARAVDLQHALARREVARRRHLFDQRLDVGAEELEASGCRSCRSDGSAADGGRSARTGTGLRRSPPCARCPASTIHCSVR